MKINENPLKILNIPNNTTMSEIHEICQKNSLLMNDESYSIYENDLNNTNKRLKAEINWFPRIQKEELKEILLGKEVKSEYNLLVKINIYRLKLYKDINIDDLEDITEKLDTLCSILKKVDRDTIIELINKDRIDSNFTLVTES